MEQILDDDPIVDFEDRVDSIGLEAKSRCCKDPQISLKDAVKMLKTLEDPQTSFKDDQKCHKDAQRVCKDAQRCCKNASKMLKESVKMLKYRSKIVQRCSKMIKDAVNMIKDAVKMLKEPARWWVVINDRFQATKNEWKCEFNEVGPWADSSTSCGWFKKNHPQTFKFRPIQFQFNSISFNFDDDDVDVDVGRTNFFLLLFDALKKKKDPPNAVSVLFFVVSATQDGQLPTFICNVAMLPYNYQP